MKDIYEDWRTYENEEIILRPVKMDDAPELFKVYSDKQAQKLFNVDNFPKPCYFDTLEQMEQELQFYLTAYQEKWFVRWSIVWKATAEVIGTIENLRKEGLAWDTDKSDAQARHAALLRMDLRSDYETEAVLGSLISLILERAYEDFSSQLIITKAPAIAGARRNALQQYGFVEMSEPLRANNGKAFGDYFVREK